MVSERTQSAATAKLIRTWETLRKQYPGVQTRYPRIVYDGRLKVTAGLAHLDKNQIRLSKYLMVEYPEKMIDVIIPHELAHLVAWEVYGDDSHNAGWQSVMQFLDLPVKEFHDMVSWRHDVEVFQRRMGK